MSLTKSHILTVLFMSLSLIACGNEQTETQATIQLKTDFYVGQFSWHFQSAKIPIAQILTGSEDLSNNQPKPQGTIIAIHGTPGSWSAWKQLMAEPAVAFYDFIAIDRPGWGDSSSIDNRVYPGLESQAAIIAHAMASMDLQPPVILVSHSWGGPVALKLAHEFEDLVDGIVLIASPADPAVSRPRWYHKAAKLKLIQWVVGSSMSRSNIEMLALDKELELLEPKLEELKIPIVIMQGKKDWLVKPQNAFFLKKKLSNASTQLMYYEKLNHFIPFNQTEEVVKALNWIIKKNTIQLQQLN